MILGLAAAGTGFYFIKRKAAEIREQGSNPELRNSKAVAVLQADRIPEGYHTVAVVSIPGMDMVMLGDQPPRPNGHAANPRERGYMYMRLFREPENMAEHNRSQIEAGSGSSGGRHCERTQECRSQFRDSGAPLARVERWRGSDVDH